MYHDGKEISLLTVLTDAIRDSDSSRGAAKKVLECLRLHGCLNERGIEAARAEAGKLPAVAAVGRG